MLFTPSIFIPKFAGALTPPLDGITTGLTGAWSVSRKMLTTHGGGFYTESGGTIQTIIDQTGGEGVFRTPTSPEPLPTISTAGAMSRACALFNGSDQVMILHGPASSYVSVSTGYIVISAIVDSISTDAADFYDNQGLIAQGSGYIGIHFRTSTPRAVFGNYTTVTTQVRGDYTAGNTAVFELRHEGGTLYGRVNGGSWVSISSGNTGSLTQNFWLGWGIGGYLPCKVFEIATYSTVPSGSDMDAISANMLEWIAG